jgi:hypothetical protein
MIPADALIFLFSEMSRPTLGPNQHLSKWVPGFLLRIKQPECAVDCSLTSSAEVQNEWSYTSSGNRDNIPSP